MRQLIYSSSPIAHIGEVFIVLQVLRDVTVGYVFTLVELHVRLAW